MTEQGPALTRHDLEAKIVKRCWENEEFRKEFTADPAAAFVKYLKVPAASLPKIVIHEEAAGSWHIVLPAKPAELSELSEAELEKVSGGTTPACVTVVVSVGVTVATAASVSSVSYTVSREVGGW
jgi:hypothetical protein